MRSHNNIYCRLQKRTPRWNSIIKKTCESSSKLTPSSIHCGVSRIIAVPRPAWPHAVLPGLWGNRGRKPPLFSITPAVPDHRANTKESGFIKTISARKEPNRLIYQECWCGGHRHNKGMGFFEGMHVVCCLLYQFKGRPCWVTALLIRCRAKQSVQWFTK